MLSPVAQTAGELTIDDGNEDEHRDILRDMCAEDEQSVHLLGRHPERGEAASEYLFTSSYIWMYIYRI